MYIEKQNFLPGVHVLRGFAALATVFYHLHFMGEGHGVNYLSFIEQFGSGVTLFFILSCFSLFHSTGSKLAYPNWIAGYVLRRLYRIYPLFIGMLIFYVIVLNIKFGKVYSISELLLNVSVLYQFYPGKHASIVFAGWTVGVEVTFYFIFPLLFSVSRSLVFWLIALVAAMILSIQIPIIVTELNLEKSYAYMSFPRQLFVFILGGVIYLVARKRGVIYNYVSFFLTLGLFVLWSLVVSETTNIVRGPGLLILKAMALGSLVWYFYDKKWLYNRFTKYLGESSYAIYLLHPAVILLCMPIINKIYEVGMPVDFAYLLSLMLVMFFLLPVSFLINKYIEMPIYYYGVRKAKIAEMKRN